MNTQSLSAFIQSKGLFMCWKGVGAVSHRGRIVSTAQSSWLPSSCAWPVALGSFRRGGLCVCVCLGGYLYRRMPPIWGWTAVLSTKFREFPFLDSISFIKKKKNVLSLRRWGEIRPFWFSLDFILYSSLQPWCHWPIIMRCAYILRNKALAQLTSYII